MLCGRLAGKRRLPQKAKPVRDASLGCFSTGYPAVIVRPAWFVLRQCLLAVCATPKAILIGPDTVAYS